MGSLTTRVVNRVSSRPVGSQSTFLSSGISYDYAIAGQPFLSAASKERPYVRKTAPYRKDQIDQTPIPGEQSMVFWWLRSQISFHGGTGILFEEPALEASILYSDPLSATAIPVRYQDSEGVDPFGQPGHVTLLPGTTLGKSATGNVILEGATDANGVDMWVQAEGSTLARCVEGSSASISYAGGTVLSLTNDGTNYYAADATSIWKGTLAGGAASAAWNTGNASVVIKWAKDRLVAAIGLSLYELVGGAPPALPQPFYTSQSPGWKWTAIEQAPDGIYVAGYAGNLSKVFYVGLTTGVGNTPILAPPIEVAELPRGEVVYTLKTCMGNYLAIGTSRSVRLAEFNGSGHISWGPAFVTGVVAPIYSISSYDRYVYAAFGNGMADGTSGLVRIDLGYQTQFQHFAWCKDLRAHVSGAVRSVHQYGSSGRLVFSVDGHGSYLQNTAAQALETTGYLKTGNIRYHTQESKLYKYVKVECAPIANGTINIATGDSGGGGTSIITFGSASDTESQVNLGIVGPKQWVNLTFTLGNDPNATNKGPTLYSYQLAALPAQKNQRYFQVPILIFDFTKDKYGAMTGYEGYAKDQLKALETYEEARDNVLFQDLSRKPFETRLVVIDDIEFQQIDPPANCDGNGGFAQITLRSID